MGSQSDEQSTLYVTNGIGAIPRILVRHRLVQYEAQNHCQTRFKKEFLWRDERRRLPPHMSEELR